MKIPLLCLLLATLHLHATEIQGVQIFPNDNAFNQDISNNAVHAKSATYIAKILLGSNKFLHADFGSNPEFGIPFVVVSGTQAKVPINIVEFPEESDPGPYPVPLNAPVEGGNASNGDRHVLVLDKDNKILYEMFNAFQKGAGWECDGAAKFDLTSNALRPAGFTSADAAGLPILPGLARFDEAAAGEITHALRFTVRVTQGAYINPATHHTTEQGPDFPPMGLRLRLKKDFDISAFTGHSKVILTALKKYGMIVADNGSDWFISGATDSRWNDDDLNQLKGVPGSAFEAVETGPIIEEDGGGSDGEPGGGGGGGGGGTEPKTLGAPKLKIGLDFKNVNRDAVQLTCFLDLSGNAGTELSIDIGGVTDSFELNAKGKGFSDTGTATLRKPKSGPAKLQLKLKGAFAQEFNDEGLESESGTPTVAASITIGGVEFTSDINLIYKVSKTKGTGKN